MPDSSQYAATGGSLETGNNTQERRRSGGQEVGGNNDARDLISQETAPNARSF